MGQDRLSKDKSGEFLDQHVHVVATTQELCHITRNFVQITRDDLRAEVPLLI